MNSFQLAGRFIAWGIISTFFCGGRLLAADRLPAPAPDDVAKAEKTVKEIYHDDYAKKKPADRAALATKLIQQAAETKDDPASKFALLKEARDLAVAGSDAATTMKAAEQLAAEFAAPPGQIFGPLAALATTSRSSCPNADAASAMDEFGGGATADGV